MVGMGGGNPDPINIYFKTNNVHFSHLNTHFVELDQFTVCQACMNRNQEELPEGRSEQIIFQSVIFLTIENEFNRLFFLSLSPAFLRFNAILSK